ncbi:hypothetical protein F5Y13DRAFT_189287 [Hypoxylon sp. FL1857]|nr:hypothetical protein F5Y13DRAFT_189287 [Hypoxylon sp. FL1857]
MLLKVAIPLSLLYVYGAIAADCDSTQFRSDSKPSGADINAAILNDPHALDICSNGFPPNSTKASSTHGGMVITFSRTNAHITPKNCKEAIKDILNQCIVPGEYYGGSWSTREESYSIHNQRYPNNPFIHFQNKIFFSLGANFV